MDTSSIDTYIRSLIVEAMRLETQDIRIIRTGHGFRIEMRVEGGYEVFPHPPAKETVDLLVRLRECAGLSAAANGQPQKARFSIPRRGRELPLEVAFHNEGAAEIADIRLL